MTKENRSHRVPTRTGGIPRPSRAGTATSPPAASEAVVTKRVAPQQDPERSVLEVVIDIRKGNLNPRLISPEDRRACVAHLCAEGLAVPEIAQFLKCSDRTVTRDRKALQEGAALHHDPTFAGRMAGHLLTEAGVSIDRIRRASRDRQTPAAVKVDAEHRCFQILDALAARLQSLGYLPTAAQKHQGEFLHHHNEIPSLDELNKQIQKLADVGGGLPEGSEARAHIAELASLANQVQLANKAWTVAAEVQETQKEANDGATPRT